VTIAEIVPRKPSSIAPIRPQVSCWKDRFSAATFAADALNLAADALNLAADALNLAADALNLAADALNLAADGSEFAAHLAADGSELDLHLAADGSELDLHLTPECPEFLLVVPEASIDGPFQVVQPLVGPRIPGHRRHGSTIARKMQRVVCSS